MTGLSDDFDTHGNVRAEGRAAMAMNRENLKQLEEHFNAFISPFLNEDEPEDLNIAWEFRKFLHSKRLKMLTAEKEGLKKWKELLLSK